MPTPDMHTQWDVARVANTMAVRTTVQIDPTKITPRIRTKLIKWLRDGVVIGGYRSEARKLADLLCEKYELPAARSLWSGIRLSNPSEELAKEVVTLLQADWASFIMELPHYNTQDSWYRRNYLRTIEELTGPEYYKFDDGITVHDRKFRDKMMMCVNKYLTDKQREQIEIAVAAVNGTEPIHCFTYGDYK